MILLKRSLSIILALLLPILLVLITARLIMSETYLSFEYHKPDFPADTYGFTLEDRLHYAPFAVRYVFNAEGIAYLKQITMPDGEQLYTDSELAHLADVKVVVQGLFVGLVGLIILALLIGVFLALRDRFALWAALLGGALLTLLILGTLAVFVITSWDTFFTQFHELFFANGNWVFDFSDSLIRLYPVRFWQDGALTLGLLTALEAVIIFMLSFWRLRRTNRKIED